MARLMGSKDLKSHFDYDFQEIYATSRMNTALSRYQSNSNWILSPYSATQLQYR